MKNVTERIASLSPDQQSVLLQRLREKKTVQPPAVFPTQASSDGWIVRYRPSDAAQLRLFCFSYAGGGASIFRQWADAFPPEVEVCCIQLPGHEYRLMEPAYTRLSALLPSLVDAITPYLDRPFLFFGHSMGALISFELARQLRRTAARQPERLCLGAYRAPQLPNPNIKIYHLPTEVFKVVLRAEGIAETILQSEELMQAMLPTLRADFELCDTYEYHVEESLECPISIFGGLADVRISEADLKAWRMHTHAAFRLSMLPGAHFFLHSAQDLLISAISQDMQEFVSLPVQ
jgi:medium-chain acyl-[acyl-carrier-protein] hydrolase